MFVCFHSCLFLFFYLLINRQHSFNNSLQWKIFLDFFHVDLVIFFQLFFFVYLFLFLFMFIILACVCLCLFQFHLCVSFFSLFFTILLSKYLQSQGFNFPSKASPVSYVYSCCIDGFMFVCLFVCSYLCLYLCLFMFVYIYVCVFMFVFFYSFFLLFHFKQFCHFSFSRSLQFHNQI